ncbi:MAG: TusE/DsrC/DsvC family sulfur relay protein [Thiomargarita sp.]|nr:TusE/DsrC/DsvC family sulfur relay protein [Thiomargarita sp.]
MIATDEDGYLVNRSDWTQAIATKAEGIDMIETHWGLVDACRQHYREQMRRPSSNKLLVG